LAVCASSLPAIAATDDAQQGPALTAPIQSTGKNGSTLKWSSPQTRTAIVNTLRQGDADDRSNKVMQAAAFVPVPQDAVSQEPVSLSADNPVRSASESKKKSAIFVQSRPEINLTPVPPSKAEPADPVLQEENQVEAVVTENCPAPNDQKYFKSLADVNTDLRPPKRQPEPGELAAPMPDDSECKLQHKSPRDLNAQRLTDNMPWCPVTFTWKASALCHKPLYFEDVQLERYGHSAGPLLQPLASAAQFYLLVPVLPYSMGLEPPGECLYSLGYYRPGSCAPYMLDPIPLSVRAGLAQAGVVTGLVFALP
jgi:hypothetical protein